MRSSSPNATDCGGWIGMVEMLEPITIDGSQGEGGGQIVRTALSLSMLTGKPLRLERIRAQRPKTGLRRQHLAAVRAAAVISGASVQGATLGAMTLNFRPRTIEPGKYSFDIGSAGSAVLLAQTLIPALLQAGAPSRLVLTGGTHNPLAPTYDFFSAVFLPVLGSMGAEIGATLVRPGFAPGGQGVIELEIGPGGRLDPITILDRGPLRSVRVQAVVSNLPRTIAEREVAVVQRAFPDCEIEVREERCSIGPGNAVSITLAFEHGVEGFTGIGQRGVRAETVAARVVREAETFLASDAAVDSHLADQLLLPFAMAGGGTFTTLEPSPHALTNAEVIERFLPIAIVFEPGPGRAWTTAVSLRRG